MIDNNVAIRYVNEGTLFEIPFYIEPFLLVFFGARSFWDTRHEMKLSIGVWTVYTTPVIKLSILFLIPTKIRIHI